MATTFPGVARVERETFNARERYPGGARGRLPTAEGLGDLPSARSGRPIARLDVSAVGTGAKALGRGIEQLGRGLSRAWSRLGRSPSARFLRYRRDEEGFLAEFQRSLAADATSAGAAGKHMQGFAERAQGFVQSLPLDQQQDYAQVVQALGDSLYGDALAAEATALDGALQGDLANVVAEMLVPAAMEAAELPPAERRAALNAILVDADTLVDDSGLPDDLKPIWKLSSLAGITAAYRTGKRQSAADVDDDSPPPSFNPPRDVAQFVPPDPSTLSLPASLMTTPRPLIDMDVLKRARSDLATRFLAGTVSTADAGAEARRLRDWYLAIGVA